MDDFAENLKNIRKSAHITQTQLAERLGVHIQTVSKWERGLTEPDISLHGEIASALGVSLEELWGLSLAGDERAGTFALPKMCAAILSVRKECGQSQGRVASALGVTAGTVSKWERGVVSPDRRTLVALASYFGLPPSALYYGQGAVAYTPPPGPPQNQILPPAEPEGENIRPRAAVAISRRRAAFIVAALFALLVVVGVVLLLSHGNRISPPLSEGGGQTGGQNGDEALACEHDFVSAVTPPTCTERGYTAYTCSLCGYSYKAAVVEANGHTRGEWAEYSSATCLHEGQERVCCTVCGEVLATRTLERLPHEYASTIVQPSGGKQGYTHHVCSLCGHEYRDNYFSQAYTEGLKYSVTDQGVVISGVEEGFGEIVIPTHIDGVPVTKIAESAFAGMSQITDIALPQTITAIGRRAFAGTSLSHITIPNSVEEIGAQIFSGCGYLTEVTYNSNFEPSENGLFLNLPSLKKVTFGGSVVPGYICCDSVSLSEVVIAEGIEEIGHHAFYNCSSLTGIDLPPSLGYIGTEVFAGSGLVGLSVPELVTSVDRAAFANCARLKSISLPYGLTSIGYLAFEGCVSLGQIDIPDSVISIEGRAFMGCSSLKSVVLPKYLTRIDEMTFEGCSSLSYVYIPSSVTVIEGAFGSCGALAEVEFGDPSGWSADGTAVAEEQLSSAATAAKLVGQTYAIAVWIKN